MALAIVRINKITVSSMEILFSDEIDQNIGIANVSITSQIDSVANPEIISVAVENDLVSITFRPLFPNVQYKIIFSSTDEQPFQTINGDRITEDGNRNSLFFSSPGEDENVIRDTMLNNISVIYETEEPSVVRTVITGIANEFQKSSDALQTVKSANYISVDVADERLIRDDGPIDKFANGGVYEVLRVASVPTGSSVAGSIEFNDARIQGFQVNATTIVNSVIGSLTEDPISLQAIETINERVTDDAELNNFFDGMLIKVANRPVIQVISVTLIRDNVLIPYDIETFGYTLLDNRYDTLSASRNVNLSDQEIELSLSSLTGQPGGFLLPKVGDEIRISYVHKRLGRDITTDSVQLSTIKNVVRELTPATITKFSLKHAPIVASNDEIPVSDGVVFLNTQAADDQPPFATIHPAFTREIRFSLSRLPARAGEYSVNYETGEVFVFGADQNNDGTGDDPPVANYTYRQIFTNNLDYTFNSDRDELAVKSIRNISGIDAKISFDYEDTFAEGEDYRFLSHIEALNERVENRLIEDLKIQTKNFPVTDVFRIFNETTGEIYTPVRFNDNSISFTGRKVPRQRDITRERATFARIPQETLLVSDELENTIGLKIFKIELENRGITDNQGRFIGANFDSSVLFSDTSIFINEMFYEDDLFDSVDVNLDRLEQEGDYLIDYNNGIVYVAVSDEQNTNIGDVTYQYKSIQTRNKHILRAYNIYRSSSVLRPNIRDYTIGAISDSSVDIVNLEEVGERFIDGNPSRVVIVGSYQNGEDGITTDGIAIFTSNTAVFTTDDLQRTLIVGSSTQSPVEEATITGIINSHQVTVDIPFAVTNTGRVWNVVDLSEDAEKIITLGNDILSVKNIYLVGQLGTVPASELDGYFDISRDSIDGNTILLGEDNPLSVGDAVIVNYNYGEVYIDYRHLQDELLISYEYGNNSLDWSISDSLAPEEEYFVTYRYGALREPLLANFGALTQIPELTTFSPNLDRETYRSVVGGTLQSFIEGPTIPSIERLVESFTDVTPNINEAAFNNWVLGRDNLHLRDVEISNGTLFDIGRYDNGVVVEGDKNVRVPALAHFRLNEGTLETWVRPDWKGLANDASLTFDIAINDEADAEQVFIGFSSTNPAQIPFTLNIDDPSVFGEPANIEDEVGYFIWFDEFANTWNMRWRGSLTEYHSFTGTITTTGEFYNVKNPVGEDGYEINEITDTITSSIKTIRFEATIDAHEDGAGNSIDGGNFTDTEFAAIYNGGGFKTSTFEYTFDGGDFLDTEFSPEQQPGFSTDGISFASDDQHFIFDMAARPESNRVSLYKDGTGYLNFQVFDNRALSSDNVGFYNLSTNIRDWQASEPHHLAMAWKFNSVDERDEMHLFVDGEEVPNLFKFGGNPKASSAYDFGDVGEEIITSAATRPIVGGSDGSSNAGSNVFVSQTVNFVELGVLVGDSFYILDDTPDGTGDPNFGTVYIITGVGENSLSLDRPLTLTIGDINYTINRIVATVTTPVNYQDFIVLAVAPDGTETELNGLTADHPDYSITRGSDNSHIISINNGVAEGYAILIKTLGLLFRRCREKIFVYSESDEIRVNAAAPMNLNDVSITAIILPRTLITADGYDGYTGFDTIQIDIDNQDISILQSTFTDVCQPSNNANGKKLAVTLSGDNINYDIPDNKVTIRGTTYSGAAEEIITFTDNGTIVTSEYWFTIDTITVSAVLIDPTQSAGMVEIKENIPLTKSENNGDYAEVVEYSNGIFRLEIFGSAGMPFVLHGHCYYIIDYPSFLRVRLNNQPDQFFIGSDYSGANRFDGVIDEFRILDTALTDTRVGETVLSGEVSITTDFNEPNAFVNDENTLFLAHFDTDATDSSVFRDRFDEGFAVAPSVNEDFGYAIKISENRPFIVDNAEAVFNNNEGTIEFWVSPIDDNANDPNFHYYIDMSPVIIEELVSATSTIVIAPQRVRSVESVRLVTDTANTGTNFFTSGSISNVDRKTITLGIPLPNQNMPVKITYTPLNSQGDRVSVYRDPNGFVNFFMRASGVDHLVSVHTNWKRHTWHRIMVMWRTNSLDNEDRLRLFVDGDERGTIKYGTGLIYGTGVIYGEAEVRPGVNRFIVDNIDLTDTFSQIFIGTDTLGVHGARARLDNIRFSEIERLQSVRLTTNGAFDVNFTSNTEFVEPVVEDSNTTGLFDFNKEEGDIEFLATLINAERGIFRFEVEVIDSFDKVIGNAQLEELLKGLIDTIKPAHTESIIKFTK